MNRINRLLYEVKKITAEGTGIVYIAVDRNEKEEIILTNTADEEKILFNSMKECEKHINEHGADNRIFIYFNPKE